MTLHMIGIGLDSDKDITLKGLERIKKSSRIFLESYTSRLNVSKEDLENAWGVEIEDAGREMVEKRSDDIISPAKDSDVAFLVIGDIFGATTHTDLILRAKEKGIGYTLTHNASIINAVSETGLELYKFGKTTSIPFWTDSYKPETAYDVIAMNKNNGLHTLALLDIKAEENRFMRVHDAIMILEEIEKKRGEGVISSDMFAVGCARMGSDNSTIFSGTLEELKKKDYGEPLHCLIIPGKMHFVEEDMLKTFQ